MARFRATIKGARGEASRLGDADTGLTVTVNGWDLGIRAVASATSPDFDVVDVYITGGSNGHAPERHLGRAHLFPSGPTFDANATAPMTDPNRATLATALDLLACLTGYAESRWHAGDGAAPIRHAEKARALLRANEPPARRAGP